MTSILSPLWRFLVTDLGGSSITVLDSLASDRTVTPKLNDPMEITATVPSDSDYVQRLHTDNFPLVSEGVRQLYCFRREEDVTPYFTIRGSGLIMQIQDASGTGDARSRFTSWDPWQYLYSRPCLQSELAGDPDPGELIPDTNQLYPASVTADEIVVDMLFNMLTFGDVSAPGAALQGFVDWGLSGFYTGTIETCAAFTDGWPVQQGTSVGQALKDLTESGYLDIVFEPIYDPANRPGLLSQVSIYEQTVDNVGNITKIGAGDFKYNAIFAWDRPGRNMVAVDNLYDGVGRANHIQYYNGQGGPPVTAVLDTASIALYGEYWAQQFFPANTEPIAVQAVAAMQLALRKTFKETLTVGPSPERAPEPFVDYYLGDAVPVYVGLGQRGTTPGDSRMRQSLPPGYTGALPSPDPFTTVWQRIYGIPVDIDDNGVETVRELIVGPVGAPPPAPPEAPMGGMASMGSGGQAVNAERRAHRPQGNTVSITPGGVRT